MNDSGLSLWRTSQRNSKNMKLTGKKNVIDFDHFLGHDRDLPFPPMTPGGEFF